MMLSWFCITVHLLLMCLLSSGQFCVTSPYLQLAHPTYDVCRQNAYCRTTYKHTDQNISLKQFDCDYSCGIDRPDLLMTSRIINSTLGIMEVTFTPLSLCNLNSYDITLYVNETLHEDKCSFIDYHNAVKHSSRTALVEVCEPDGTCVSKEPCDENITVVFNHVFTGCYFFHIQPKDGSNTKKGWKVRRYIPTDYKKKLVTGANLRFSVQYYKFSESMELSVVFPFLPRASLLTLIEGIDPSLESDACHETGHKHSSCKMCTDESKIECDDKDLSSNNTCKYQKGLLACKFHDVPYGNYCARIEFIDDRCGTSSVWADDVDPCIWQLDISEHIKLNNLSGPVTYAQVNNHMTTFTVMLIVASCIIMLSLLAFVVYRTLFAQYRVFIPTYNKELKPLHVKERPIVLLLYARDCDMFMNVMAEFRSVLKSSLKCQVFDCWDPAQYEKVAQSPTDWVLSLIADRSVRIILVSTACSRLLEISLLTDKKVQYRQPDAFDKLFIFALRHLTESTILDSYNRIFVVRLDKNAQNNNSSFTYLNPLTVHCLPTHLDKLMLGLHRVDAMEYAVSILNLPDVKHFSSSVESFQNFVHDNPYYLDYLLEKAEPDIV